MLKKIIVGILIITVIGAAIATFAYKALANESDTEINAAISPLSEQQPTISLNQENAPGFNAQDVINEEQPWEAEGEIMEINTNGITLRLADNSEVFVELGPDQFWQEQGLTLQPGMQVRIEGTENSGMIHAYNITAVNGSTLQLRTESGQPMWSGGIQNSQGQNGNRSGSGQPDPQSQVQVDEWVTIRGVVASFQGGNMTINTTEGDVLAIQTGQPRFFASQSVTFAVGDEVELVGYYEGDQFVAGDITQLATNLRVMLRDPNGRPLWAGPGNGKGNGGGNH
jgi:hypothetical protein